MDEEYIIGLPTVISDNEDNGNEADDEHDNASLTSPTEEQPQMEPNTTEVNTVPPEFICFDLNTADEAKPTTIEDEEEELEPLTNPQALW